MDNEKIDILLETVNYCNLYCPACPWHNTMTREKRILYPEEFSRIFEHILDYSKSILFYVMGEPLLNKYLFDYVKIVHDAGIRTGISTNGMLIGEYIDDIFISGLDYIQIALDGLDAPTHENYRVGSNYYQIISNLKLLVYEKKKRNKKSPEIQIQTLIRKQNEKKLMDFQMFADELGVGFSAKKMMFGKTEDIISINRTFFEPKQQKYQRMSNPNLLYYKDMEICPQSKSLTILCNGDVVPCCYDYNGTVVLGNLIKQTLPEIEQGEAKDFFYKRSQGSTSLCALCDLAMEKKRLPEAVLFDFGRTLVIMPDIDIRKGIACLLESLGEKNDSKMIDKYYDEREKYITQMCPDKKRRMIYPETKVMKFLFDKFHIHTNKTDYDLEKIFSEGCSLGKPTEGITELLRTLRSMGIATGVITNNRYSSETVKWKLEKIFPEHVFDAIISSTDANCHKPDIGMFELAISELQINPEKMWFVGDSLEDDIRGSYQLGMKPFWYIKYAKISDMEIYHREDCMVIREWKEMEHILVESTEVW